MNNKTLNLKASKAISALGVEVESEMWHEVTIGNTDVTHSNIVTDENKNLCENDIYLEFTQAYNLQELFSALPAIGEKMGVSSLPLGFWEFTGSSYNKRAGDYQIKTNVLWNEYHTHKIAQKYIQNDGGMDAVSAYLLELLYKK